MKSVIVGTAGHIDHGKTALVKALTGIDADRLEEEKRRGITIDIGFAHLELPGPQGEKLRLGFVDVPGHERFVRNMLAGIGGIDLVLLVIAADESIKPQTREHFDICRMLNIRRGITVLTKSDLVDHDTLEVVRLEVEDFLRGSFLEDSPIIPVSSLSGSGLEELKHAVTQLATEVPAKDSRAIFRLPIDRVFTMKGFGTVVTGTLISGTVRKEEELEVFPSARRVRVRGIQVHGAAADQAIAGQRTALNLAGATTEQLTRGMMLAPSGLFRVVKRVRAQLTLLPGARPLRDRARAHFHCYTAETIAEVLLLAVEARGFSGAKNAQERSGASAPEGATLQRLTELGPDQTAWVELRFAEPLLLLPGDRFILRQFSPVVTIGGGVVVDNAPPSFRRGDSEALNTCASHLKSLSDSPPAQQLLVRVMRRGQDGLSLADAVAETGWTNSQLDTALTQTLAKPEKFHVTSGASFSSGAGNFAELKLLRFGNLLVTNSAFVRAQIDLLRVLTAFHDTNPLVAGVSREELREKLGLGPEIFAGVIDALVREKKLDITGDTVKLSGRGVVMKDEETASQRQIEHAFATAGLKVPALKEVLAGLQVDRTRAQKIVTLLLRDRVLIKVNEELVFHRDALDALRKLLAEYKKKSPKIDVGKFKDLTGVSRKYAIPLLEYLDREHVTRRVGDERVIL